jgi:hypothetical protein
MTCDDYLALLETLPLAELNYGEAREHCAQCHDCNRVTRVVAERERSMMLAFGGVYPTSSSSAVAGEAVTIARRRRLATFYRAALGLAAAAVLAFIAVSRTVSSPAVARQSRTFPLRCLSPEQAAEALRLAMDSRNVSVSIRPPVGVVSVAGSPQEVMRARAILDRLDRSSEAPCMAQMIVPSGRSPSR